MKEWIFYIRIKTVKVHKIKIKYICLDKITWHLSYQKSKSDFIYVILEVILIKLAKFSSVQSLHRVWLFATPWIAARQAFLSITISQSSLKLMSIESVMPSSRLILCRPLLLLSPIPPSIRVFSNGSSLHMSGQSTRVSTLASFLTNTTPGWSPLEWIDWISLQSKGLSSILQHHSSKASILRCSAFFTVQLSHPYVTTGKTIA